MWQGRRFSCGESTELLGWNVIYKQPAVLLRDFFWATSVLFSPQPLSVCQNCIFLYWTIFFWVKKCGKCVHTEKYVRKQCRPTISAHKMVTQKLYTLNKHHIHKLHPLFIFSSLGLQLVHVFALSATTTAVRYLLSVMFVGSAMIWSC